MRFTNQNVNPEVARIALVPLARVHLERTRTWANDPALMRLMDRAAPVSDSDHQQWFDSLATRTDCAYFAVETVEGGAHVGNAWLWAIDPRHRKAELRIVIGDAAARGHGVGSEVIDRLCRTAFSDMRLHRIYAYVLQSNPAARRAFERAGFAVEGLLRDDRWTGEGFTDAYLLARVDR